MGIYQELSSFFVKTIGNICWKTKKSLSKRDQEIIKQKLYKDYYIMLSRRNNHLSTYFISIAHFMLTGKFGYWSHAFMNLEGDVSSPSDIRLVEATGRGVTYTPFYKVFNVTSTVLLKPKTMDAVEWCKILEKAKTQYNKPYDNLFDLKNDNALSCVELVRSALMADPNYERDFPNFERMIKKYGNLTPQMFYDCPDFEVVLEIRK